MGSGFCLSLAGPGSTPTSGVGAACPGSLSSLCSAQKQFPTPAPRQRSLDGSSPQLQLQGGSSIRRQVSGQQTPSERREAEPACRCRRRRRQRSPGAAEPRRSHRAQPGHGDRFQRKAFVLYEAAKSTALSSRESRSPEDRPSHPLR